MNHDEDDDLHFVDPCGWHVAIGFLLLAIVVGLAGLGLKTLLEVLS